MMGAMGILQQLRVLSGFRVAGQPGVIALCEGTRGGSGRARSRRNDGTIRSWDELEADLLEQCLVTRVGMEKVEEWFVLHLDHVRCVFAVSLLEILQGLLFVAGQGDCAGHLIGVDITLASAGFYPPSSPSPLRPLVSRPDALQPQLPACLPAAGLLPILPATPCTCLSSSRQWTGSSRRSHHSGELSAATGVR